MLGIRLRRRVKFGDVIRDNQCLDMDLNRSEITGNLSKRSVLDMTVHTYEGSLLSVMCSSDDALPSSSPVTTSDPTCNSEKVLRIISMEKMLQLNLRSAPNTNLQPIIVAHEHCDQAILASTLNNVTIAGSDTTRYDTKYTDRTWNRKHNHTPAKDAVNKKLPKGINGSNSGSS
ncbi:hypothetical protein Tco_1172982 [Tanacetum coccineum]